MENALILAPTTSRSTSLPLTPEGPAPAGGLEDVFARFLDPVYSFLYRRVGNREDAEDLTSEVFLRAARQMDIGRSELSLARWLFTVARTVLADHWRQYYQTGAVLPFDEGVELRIEPHPQQSNSEATQRLIEAVLASLSDRHRQVLELRFLRGYSIQETATEMGITSTNAKVLQHRALARAVQLAEEEER